MTQRCDSFDGKRKCRKRVYAKGRCRNCYERFNRNGTTLRHRPYQIVRKRELQRMASVLALVGDETFGSRNLPKFIDAKERGKDGNDA